MAVGAAGRGGHWHRLFILCPGAGEQGWNAPDDPDGALRIPFHPHGGSQHPGLPAMRLLAVYYQQDVTTEQFDRFDGERSANG